MIPSLGGPLRCRNAWIGIVYTQNIMERFLNRFIRIVCFNAVRKVLIKTCPVTHIWPTTFRDRLGWSLDHVWWLVHPDEVFLEFWMIWSYTWLRLYVAPLSLFMALFPLRLTQIDSLIKFVALPVKNFGVLPVYYVVGGWNMIGNGWFMLIGYWW